MSSTTPTFVRSYLFSLNQSQLELYLLDPTISFDALCSAMNESLPSSVGSLAASHCLRLISDSFPQFAAFENWTFIGFLSSDKSIFRDLCPPEDRPPDLTHALFTLDVPSFLLSVCPPSLDLCPCMAKLHCAAEFAIKLPQHAQKVHGPVEEGSDSSITAVLLALAPCGSGKIVGRAWGLSGRKVYHFHFQFPLTHIQIWVIVANPS